MRQKFLGYFFPAGVSQISVNVAYTMEKAESIPSKNRVRSRIIAHTLETGIISQAVGYAMKARPIYDTLFYFSKRIFGL